MRILYVVSTLKKSGPTNQLFNIISNLDRQIFEPILLTLSPEPADSRWHDYEQLGVEVRSLNQSRIRGLLFAKSQLAKLINGINPDIVHTQGIRADTLLSSIKPSLPWVLTARNYPFDDYPSKFGKLRGAVMARKHVSVLKKCSHTVACSKAIKTKLAAIDVESMAIQNGVSLGGSVPDTLSRYTFESPVFITVGSLIPRKNVQMLVHGFNQWKKESRSLGSLVVVGDGFERSSLEAEAIKNISFVGNVDNVADYLLAADYFVSASLSEGLPNTVLEALASGLPVILSDILPHKEIFNECSGACRVFKLSDGINGLVGEFKQASTFFDDASRIDAKRVASNVFSAEVMSKHYQQYYLRLLERK